MRKGKIVFSTNPDWQENCPECDQSLYECACNSKGTSNSQSRVVYIKREVKGRKGKTVTTISNTEGEAKYIQKELQRLCGAGGTIKNGIIEIQGDHREKIKEHLEKKECKLNWPGGRAVSTIPHLQS